MNRVIVENYDVSWPQRFEVLRSRIASLLNGAAAAIEHIGSTAVPGLAAKPIIDIDVLVKSERDLPSVIAALVSLGYKHRGDLGITGREAFRAASNDFPHHLYVCLPNHDEFHRHITFRDYLRSHPNDACAYQELKRDLAHRLGSNREAYAEAKSDFVNQILLRASRGE